LYIEKEKQPQPQHSTVAAFAAANPTLSAAGFNPLYIEKERHVQLQPPLQTRAAAFAAATAAMFNPLQERQPLRTRAATRAACAATATATASTPLKRLKKEQEQEQEQQDLKRPKKTPFYHKSVWCTAHAGLNCLEPDIAQQFQGIFEDVGEFATLEKLAETIRPHGILLDKIKRQDDKVAFLLNTNTTGKFIAQAGTHCFAVDCDKQVIFDNHLRYSLPLNLSNLQKCFKECNINQLRQIRIGQKAKAFKCV
jgi:hypothetical protein